MDSIALAREPDPRQPDWVVGARFDSERLVCLDALEMIFGIVVISGVLFDYRNLQSAGGSGLLIAANRGWKKRDEVVFRIES